jgi:biotin transport system permease protein
MISLTSPIRTRFHDWPAGGKLAGLCVTTIVLFHIDNPTLLCAVVIGVICLYALSGRVFLWAGMKELYVLWPFIVVVGVWHFWNGNPTEGWVIVMRMVSTVALANFVTMTTRLSDMTEVINYFFSPLRFFGLSVRAMELGMALVIRMTPMFVEKGNLLALAWQARTPRRPKWQLLFPFSLLVLDDADHVAEALRARGGLNERNNH